MRAQDKLVHNMVLETRAPSSVLRAPYVEWLDHAASYIIADPSVDRLRTRL